MGSRTFSAEGERVCRVANKRQHATSFPWILRCWNLGIAFLGGRHPLDGRAHLAGCARQLANLFCRRTVFSFFSETMGRSRIFRYVVIGGLSGMGWIRAVGCDSAFMLCVWRVARAQRP